MAVLSNADRIAVWEQWMRDNKEIIAGALTKAQLRAAVDAIDDFLNNNAAAINTAFPVAARTALSAGQKAAIVSYVAMRRWGAGA
jgi:hypothetical protein